MIGPFKKDPGGPDGKAIGEMLAGVLQITLGLFARDPDLRVLIIVRNQRTRDQYEIANVETLAQLRNLSDDCAAAVRSKTTIEGLGVVEVPRGKKGPSS